ncbi:unnamed protein product, partial [Staurois parvus]
PPLSVLHPSLSIPPLASTQCPPPLSANPSTGLHSVSSTPICQSLHSCPPPLSAIHTVVSLFTLNSPSTCFQMKVSSHMGVFFHNKIYSHIVVTFFTLKSPATWYSLSFST